LRHLDRAKRDSVPTVNIVVIIADALRLDSVFGAHSAMPRLEGRLRSWDTMDQYFSAAPWTLPACTSLFTGRDASVHGHFSHLHSLRHPTLVARFGDDRIKAAFVNNRALAPNSGLFADFDEYELIEGHAETFARAHRFLDERAADSRAYFLVLHSNIVHDYYLASTRRHYDERYPERNDWFELGTRVIRWEGLDTAQQATVRRVYGACAAALDLELDRVLDRFDDDTLVLFVSDHGEGLEPEVERVHHGGRLHEDLLRVPCSIRLPRSTTRAAARAIESFRARPVTTPDLLPTLLGVAGAPVPDDIEGRDLTRLATDSTTPRLRAADDRYLYVRRRYRLNLNSQGKNMLGTVRQVNNVLRATVAHRFRIRTEIEYPYKLVVTDFEARNRAFAWLGRQTLRAMHVGTPVVVARDLQWRGLECFDLAWDRHERRNLLLDGARCPDAARALAAPYREFADVVDGRAGVDQTSSGETIGD
jgi:arylsulfatase A-like enzyme